MSRITIEKRTYEVRFTRAALEAAARHGGFKGLEKQVREELDHLLATGLPSLAALSFHTVALGSYFDESLPQFLVRPVGSSMVKVDLAVYDPGEVVTEGPFAGKVMQIPTGDGDDDDEEGDYLT